MQSIYPITLLIIISNIYISFKGFKNFSFFEKYKFNIYYLKKKEYYRLISSGFLHVDSTHLIFNMITLYFFSQVVLYKAGVLSFIFIYIGSLIIGNIASYYYHFSENNYSAVGASGAVSGILFSSILIYPEMELFIFFIPIPIPGYIFVIGYMIYTLYGMKSQSDSIGHVTHFGGAISGILISLLIMPQLLIESSWVIIILLSTIIISGYYLFKLKK